MWIRTLACVVCVFVSSTGLGQSDTAGRNSQPQNQRSGVRGVSAARVLEARFNRFGPKVGDPLPDVAAYDEEGNEFKLVSLKGHFTVLAFGCLT